LPPSLLPSINQTFSTAVSGAVLAQPLVVDSTVDSTVIVATRERLGARHRPQQRGSEMEHQRRKGRALERHRMRRRQSNLWDHFHSGGRSADGDRLPDRPHLGRLAAELRSLPSAPQLEQCSRAGR
jgi:hypothetical protein